MGLIRNLLTLIILGMIVYGLFFVVMGFPHPRWMHDLVKEATGYELITTEGPVYTFDPDEGRVYKKDKK